MNSDMKKNPTETISIVVVSVTLVRSNKWKAYSVEITVVEEWNLVLPIIVRDTFQQLDFSLNHSRYINKVYHT